MDAEASAQAATTAAQRIRNQFASRPQRSLLKELIGKFYQRFPDQENHQDIDYVYDMMMALLAGKDMFPNEAEPTNVERIADE